MIARRPTADRCELLRSGWRGLRSVEALLVALLIGGESRGQSARFVNVAPSKGLASFNSMTGDGHGPGAVFTDLNNDGYADAYLMNAFGGPNALFVNQPAPGGQRTFVRADNDAGAGDRGDATGAVAADYDNDGDLDLYVLNFSGSNALYQNQLTETGQFSYVNVTQQTIPAGGGANQLGVADARHAGQSLNLSLTAAWGDPDRDGKLDLYVGNHFEWFGSPQLQPGEIPGQRDIFYRNNGDGTFSDVTMAVNAPGYETSSGLHATSNQDFSSSNAVVFADFNNDQWPDLLVTNKVGGPDDRDMLYVNQGQDEAGQWQGFVTATYAMPSVFGHRSGGAMGVDVADLDHDGDLDFYITDWSPPHQFPNNGSNDYWINQFAQTGELNFIHSGELPALYSWGTQLEDFDNNGWQDVHVVTQHDAPDFLYLNSADGFTSDVANAAGVAQVDNARGDQAADYDRDGLLDLLVINPYDGPTVLYENRSDETGSANHFLSIKLLGSPDLPGPFKSSRDALGARLTIEADLDGSGHVESRERMLREVLSGSSNAASTSSLDVEVGLGQATVADVEILWPSGRRLQMTLDADQFLTMREILADFNADGVVNGLDGRLWQTEFNSTAGGGATGGDADLDGVFRGADFVDWQRSLGAAALGAAAEAVAIPEPRAAYLALIALFRSPMRRRRRVAKTLGAAFTCMPTRRNR